MDEGVGLSEVQGRLYVNKVFHISANKMFELLFSDSSFMRRFMDIRKVLSKCLHSGLPSYSNLAYFIVSNMEICPLLLSDLSSTAWEKDSSGNSKRSLNYTVTINNPLIGKFSTATENQVCLHVWAVHGACERILCDSCYLHSISDVIQRVQRRSLLPRRHGGVHSRGSLPWLLLCPQPLLHRTQLQAEVSTQVNHHQRTDPAFCFHASAFNAFITVASGFTPVWNTRSSHGVWSSLSSLKTPGATSRIILDKWVCKQKKKTTLEMENTVFLPAWWFIFYPTRYRPWQEEPYLPRLLVAILVTWCPLAYLIGKFKIQLFAQ